MPGAKAARSMRESLDLAAREAHDLVDLGDHVQGVISRLVAAALPTDPSVMMDAQTADLLSQRLEGLARFVRALAEVAPHDLAADVAALLDDQDHLNPDEIAELERLIAKAKQEGR